MNTWLEIQRADGVDKRSVTVVRSTAFASEHGLVEGECPGCKAKPFRIQGHGTQRVNDDTVRAGTRCMNCKDPVGWCYTRVSTIFGLEEDERVLHGRPRVY